MAVCAQRGRAQRPWRVRTQRAGVQRATTCKRVTCAKGPGVQKGRGSSRAAPRRAARTREGLQAPARR
eukprot:3865116-Prymnesium_polylepis.1